MASTLRYSSPTEIWKAVASSQKFEEIPERVGSKPEGSIRVVCISDTHGKHGDVAIPAADILLHAGDITNLGELEQLQDFHSWIQELPVTYKLVIAGNHDITIQEDYYNENGINRFHKHLVGYSSKECRSTLEDSKSVVYLEDSTAVIKGLNIWGSPWQPEFHDWAYNLPRGEALKEKWDLIPVNTDILITHGPPLGRGDEQYDGLSTGCFDLMKVVQEKIKPKVHIFGHIHEAYGVSYDGDTIYVNASNCTLQRQCTNSAIVFDLDLDEDGKISSTKIVRSQVSRWSKQEVKDWVYSHCFESNSENHWPKQICEFVADLDGASLLKLDYNFVNTHWNQRKLLPTTRSRIQFLLDIRRLEAENM